MLSRLVVVAAATLACSLAQAQPVVKVLVFKGAPEVVAKGKRAPVTPGQELSRDAEIAVPTAGWLVLQILQNDVVVKIDEDLTLPVRDLALLDAPRSGASVLEQLEAMASRQEIGVNDRITGYQNRRVAGEGSAPHRVRTDATREARAEKEKANKKVSAFKSMPQDAHEVDGASASSSLAPPPPSSPSPSPAPPPYSKSTSPAPPPPPAEMPAKSPPPPRPPAETPAERPPLPAFAWATVHDGKVAPQTARLDEEIARALVQAKVARCIEAAWKAAGLPVPPLDRLLLRRVGGKVKARLGSQLALDPACLARLDAVASKLPEQGWLRVDIALAAP